MLAPDGLYRSQQRFGMYRWHLLDPIHFASDAARRHPGARAGKPGHRYQPLSDDIASTAWFYLDRPTAARPPFPPLDVLAVGGFRIDPLR